ncbi:MAG: T9SS type A sorting domain-containing protein, partial [Bacteroidia bacterium]|nr:T9SS type A sorting domain-containing protein [Bacteroidia bacterium]
VVTQLGDYQVEIGSANGCTEISNIYTITIISPPGIDEGAEEIDLQIFPNPTADVFNIAFELEETANVKITLRNALSQDLILLNEEKIRGKYENQFDATNYTDGIYLLEIDVDDVSFNRKLIIAR